jgi:hypothetical protein
MDGRAFFIRVNECTRHVVHGDMELGFLFRHFLLSALSRSDVGIRHEQAITRDGSVLDVEYSS